MSMKSSLYDKKGIVGEYVKNGPSRFAPGYEDLLKVTASLLSESAGENGKILVLGAGGGNELSYLTTLANKWSFCAIDPSTDMISLARSRLEEGIANDQVQWVEGYIADAPNEKFDAALCLMTLHLLPDDGSKLACLKEIRSRVKSGGQFVVANNCIDFSELGAEKKVDRYVAYARANGAPEEILEQALTFLKGEVSHMVSPQREEELLSEAGFKEVELIYTGLSWRGWCATA